jgi:hypothetical protein
MNDRIVPNRRTGRIQRSSVVRRKNCTVFFACREFGFCCYAPCGGSVGEFALFPRACAWGYRLLPASRGFPRLRDKARFAADRERTARRG